MFEDTIKGGSWHHCFDCGSQGDLIDLARAVWNLPLDACLEKLYRLGLPLPPVTDDQVSRQADSTARTADFQKFWEVCKARLNRHRSGEANALRARFRLVWRGDPARWDAGPGMMVGTARAKVVERLFAPTFEATSTSRVFQGRGWGEVLVMAYHDLPDRVAGLFFVGREGSRRDMVWRRVPRFCGEGKRVSDEFGLAGLPLAADRPGPVVCLNDPLLACRLQVRQAAVSGKPLPFVAWHEGQRANTRTAWRALAGRELVFWGWRLTSRLVRQAVATGGRLCLAGPEDPGDRDAVDHYLRLNTAEDLYRLVCRAALPWEEFLSRKVLEGTDGWCEGLFLQLQREGADVEGVLAALSTKARRLVGGVLRKPPAERTAMIGNYRITERNQQWHALRVMNTAGHLAAPMQLTNFVLRVDEVVLKGDEPYYRGRIYCNDDKAGFELPQAELETGCTATLRRVFYQAGWKTHLWVRDDLWSRKLLPIALAFGPVLSNNMKDTQNGGTAAPESPKATPEPPGSADAV